MWVGHDYLVDAYRNPVYPIVRSVEIAGLPALERQTVQNSASCETIVGVAELQSLDTQTDVAELRSDGSPVSDPCAEGRRVVEAIVSTLPPK